MQSLINGLAGYIVFMAHSVIMTRTFELESTSGLIEKRLVGSGAHLEPFRTWVEIGAFRIKP